MTMTLFAFVKHNEGLKLKPYRCTAGKLTIGYGRNLDDVGITQGEADILLRNDLIDAQDHLVAVFGWQAFERWSNRRKIALADMMFNLGRTRFSGFRKMIDAINDGDWGRAADEAVDSRWYRQVGDRGVRVVQMLREG